MGTSKGVVGIAVSLLLVLTLPACGSGDGSDTSPSGDNGGNAAAQESGGGGAAATSTVLNVAEEVPPESLDPQGSQYGASFYAWELSYECLYTVDDQGNPQPELATSYNASKDGLTYTFKLRDGVKFHNGADFTAEDVVYTFDRLKASGIPYAQDRFVMVESVTAPSPDKVKFTLSEPSSSFLFNMADPGKVACAILSREASDAKLGLEMIGTGPYRMTSYRPNQELDAERFADYWGEKPKNGGVKITYVPDASTRLSDLTSGKVDVIWADSSTVETLRSAADVEIAETPPAQVEMLNINTMAKPWDDVRVRRALSLAIDRDAVGKVAFAGTGTPNGFFPPANEWAVKLSDSAYGQRDIEQAKRLLAEAGYPDGLDANLIYVAHYSAQNDRQMELLQSQLGEAGIRIKLEPLEQPVWSERLNKPDYDLANNRYGYFADPFQYLRPRPNRQGEPPDEIQTLLDQLNEPMTVDEYRDRLNEIAKLEQDMIFPAVTIVAWKSFVAYRSNVTGVELDTSLSRLFLSKVSAG